MQVQSLGWEDLLEKGMATHSSTLAWRILCTQEASGATVRAVTKSQTRLSDLACTQREQTPEIQFHLTYSIKACISLPRAGLPGCDIKLILTDVYLG